jgi:hypothetical protein
MKQIKYLIDEQLADWLREALWRLEPAVEISVIADNGVLPRRTPDAVILNWAEANEVAILTRDTNTMIEASNRHCAVGGNTWGLFVLRKGFSLGPIVEDLHLIWSISNAEEWRNRVEYIPF